MATTVRPARGIGTGGWLSMAPQVDDGTSGVRQPIAHMEHRNDSTMASPSIPGSAEASPVVPPARSGGDQTHRLAKASLLLRSTPHNDSTVPPRVATSSSTEMVPPSRMSIPRTNARFSVGDTGSQVDSPDIATPPSPTYSDRSGDGDHSPPPFDVRNSFAPMRWGQPGPMISSRRASAAQDGQAGNRLIQGNGGKVVREADGDALDQDGNGVVAEDGAEDAEQEAEEEEHRFVLGGRKFKGKTAQAIELEMEALGDRTVMSYAPDAVYLASRLEGLRRNLEAGGTRFQRRWWEDLEDAETDDLTASNEHEKFATPPAVEQLAEPPASRVANAPVSPPQSPAPVPASQPSQANNLAEQTIHEDIVMLEQEVATKAIDPLARQAALDSRVEIRTLRRPDLEQVRELHCYHGDGDKEIFYDLQTHHAPLAAVFTTPKNTPNVSIKPSPVISPQEDAIADVTEVLTDFDLIARMLYEDVDTDTYTTSAAFLLRLLVDEHYVCLVAVAKPLPEPPTLPNASAPRPPPPSLDMPASRSPFLLAGKNGNVSEKRRPSSNLNQSFLPPMHAGMLQNATPAPRSFGAGPDSSENASSMNEESEEEERMRQDSLFERAKAASTYVTGDTSPPLGEMDEEMSDIAEEDEKAMQSSVGHGTALGQHHLSPFASSPRNTPSRRLSSSTHSRHGVLAGPTFDVAPPRAIRVMGAPPLGGIPLESETILGVASARIKVVQRAADDFGMQAQAWQSGVLAGPNGVDRDASWPGLDPKGERSVITREAHIMTLSVLPGERGQGLGARLLDRLLDECKRRTAGPRINLASGSTVPEGTGEAPPRAHQDAPMRTVLEMHPSNSSALQLYQARQFRQVAGNRGVIKHFFRGDQRIPSSIRLKIGGSDAVRMERIDLPSSAS